MRSIAERSLRSESSRSCFCAVRKANRSPTSFASSMAVRLTSPSASTFSRNSAMRVSVTPVSSASASSRRACATSASSIRWRDLGLDRLRLLARAQEVGLERAQTRLALFLLALPARDRVPALRLFPFDLEQRLLQLLGFVAQDLIALRQARQFLLQPADVALEPDLRQLLFALLVLQPPHVRLQRLDAPRKLLGLRGHRRKARLQLLHRLRQLLQLAPFVQEAIADALH